MGCGGSKASTVTLVKNRPLSVPGTKNEQVGQKAENPIATRPFPGVKFDKNKDKKPNSADLSKSRNRPESGAVNVSVGGLRGTSAASDRSVDSGIGGDTKDGASQSAKDAEIVSEKGLPPIPGILSTITERPRPRVDEESIMNSLRQEGLLGAASTSTTKGGLCFEVPLGELKVPSRRPPVRLQRLNRMEAMNTTNEQIREKLAVAEDRRKKRETEKIQKSREKDAKNLEIKLALLEIEKDREIELKRQQTVDIDKHVVKRADSIEQTVDKQKTYNGKIISARGKRRPISGSSLAFQSVQNKEETTASSNLQ